jgi:hypothetical protein
MGQAIRSLKTVFGLSVHPVSIQQQPLHETQGGAQLRKLAARETLAQAFDDFTACGIVAPADQDRSLSGLQTCFATRMGLGLQCRLNSI